uniref:Secreted protein n=1 Tax=Macrostomum lignano TaxID=282301 RepID=A0A1I8FWX2_9PLAT
MTAREEFSWIFQVLVVICCCYCCCCLPLRLRKKLPEFGWAQRPSAALISPAAAASWTCCSTDWTPPATAAPAGQVRRFFAGQRHCRSGWTARMPAG